MLPIEIRSSIGRAWPGPVGRTRPLILALLVVLMAPACVHERAAPVSAERPIALQAPSPAHDPARDAEPDVPVTLAGRPLGVLRLRELPPALALDGDVFALDAYVIAARGPRGVSRADVVGTNGAVKHLSWATQAASPRFQLPKSARGAVTLVGSPDDIAEVRLWGGDEPPPPAGDGDSEASHRALDRGTRVYIDGELVGVVRRRRLFGPKDESRADEPNEDDRPTTMPALLASVGAKVDSLRAVDIVSGDDVVGRVESANTSAIAQLAVLVPPHSHGRVRVVIPAMFAAGKVAPPHAPIATALLFSRETALRAATLVPVTEATERRAARGLGGRRSDHEEKKP